MKSDYSNYEGDFEIPDTDNGHTSLGLLFGCLFPVITKPKIGLIEYSFQKVKPNGKLTNKVFIFLTNEEFWLANKFTSQKHGI